MSQLTATTSTQFSAKQPDSVTQLLAAVRGLRPLIDETRGAFDRDRQLPATVARAIAESGVLGMWLPRTLGGPELDPVSYIRVIEELAAIDGSVGWCAMIGSMATRFAGFFEPAVARQIFGEGKTIVAFTPVSFGTAVAVDGGYRVSGRWGYASFIGHADWLVANCMEHGASGPLRGANGAPQMRMVALPKAAIKIHDTWQVGGLRGTGSHDIEVTDAFVPGNFSLAAQGFKMTPREQGPVYTLPPLTAFALSAVALGIARAAVDATSELLGRKTALFSSAPLREQGVVQMEFARALALLRSGRALLMEELQEVWEELCAAGQVSLRQRGDLRLACWQSVHSAAKAVDLLYALAGSSALREQSPLERCFRDVHAVRQHQVFSSLALEVTGKVLLGLDPGPVPI